MKKYVCLTCVVLIISILFCACFDGDKISSIIIDDIEYKTIYLYSFRDAQLDKLNNEHKNLRQPEITPSVYGFVYSDEKLSPGDSIRVWDTFLFSDSSSATIGSLDFGTTAVVDKLIEVHTVKVESKKDTYKITCYQFGDEDYKTATKKEDLTELEVQKIEVVKERVTIKYE